MSAFTEKELAYLNEHDRTRLARVATVGADGTPHVVPVGWRFDPEHDAIEITGYELERTKKYRDARRSGRVAAVIDDLATVEPWRPRGIEVRGRAEAVTSPRPLLRIHPERIVSWGIESDVIGERHSRRASASDAAAIHEAVAALERAQQAEDVDGFMRLFSENSVWTTAHGMRMIGRSTIGDFTARVLPGAMAEATARYEVAKISFLRDDVAVVSVDQIPIALDGTPIEDEPEGRPTYVMVKEGGRWLITAGQNTQVYRADPDTR